MAALPRSKNNALQPKRSIKHLIITAFCIIIGMVLLIGASAYYGMDRLNSVNERNNDSNMVLLHMNGIESAIKEAEDTLTYYYSGNGWKTYVDNGTSGSAFFNMAEGQLMTNVIYNGTQFWTIQIMQGSFRLIHNNTYTLTFEASSTIDRDIEVLLESSVDYNKHLVHQFHLTKELKTFSLPFRMDNATDKLAHIVFALGNVNNAASGLPEHNVVLRNVSLMHVDSGQELINNGQFLRQDIDGILADVKNKFDLATNTSRMLTADSQEQLDALKKLADLEKKWLDEMQGMITELNYKIKISGVTNTDTELQSYQSNRDIETAMKSVISQIKQTEAARLEIRKKESHSISHLIYIAFGVVVGLSVALSVAIYVYFNKAITRPIIRTSILLKEMAEGDLSRSKGLEIKQEQVSLAIQEVSELYTHVVQVHQSFQTQIRHDSLTGLFNRRMFDNVIQDWVDQRLPFALLLLDVDNFKTINDTFGHLTGDEVLKKLAETMLAASREEDVCFRYGGEEFGILLQRDTADELYALAEQLRQNVHGLRGKDLDLPPITVSIGIASLHVMDESPSSVIERADAALYESKARGKDRVTLA
ncbi:diguanylate cyclase [Paenibacillus curdlanolyticus YK9]|uniref:Diguanylate cyclase n=1 Tax=Paenibacillus curdlanolyticus YK9 TaxID=717606 RepID=E0IF35_9BACL|nr:diguanylate cyclase [Paenibacillus curdlanolyticus]EFM08811.1 diguanylate cyclase [Paenibacillus curdlanolyticus YK9]